MENHRQRSRRAFSSSELRFLPISFSQIAATKNLVPYLVISFLDNVPRDVSRSLSRPHLPCFSPLSFPPVRVFSQGLHTEYFDRPNCLLARLIFIGPRGGEQVQRKHSKKRNFPAPPPDRVTNAPTTSITGG